MTYPVSISQNGIGDMIYRGDANLIHISDGKRAGAGISVAEYIDKAMRDKCENRTPQEILEQALCPGCYMVVVVNAAITLATRNGQSCRELALTMATAFQKLAENPDLGLSEEIQVILDPCD